MSPTPTLADRIDWPKLALAARRFRDDRARMDPQAVPAMPRDTAWHRAAVAEAAATIFTCIERQEDIPALPLPTDAIQRGMAEAARRLAALAAQSPDKPSLHAYAARIAIIADHLASHITGAHAINQHYRALHASGAFKKGGRHVDRSAERAPEQSTAAPGTDQRALKRNPGPVHQGALL